MAQVANRETLERGREIRYVGTCLLFRFRLRLGMDKKEICIEIRLSSDMRNMVMSIFRNSLFILQWSDIF